MKRVLLINGSLYLPGEGGYKRTLCLFDMMKGQGYDVTLITGDFNHYAKKKRDVKDFYLKYPNYKNVIILPKITYKRNISVLRYTSDIIFSYTVANWIQKHISAYDVVYLNMPDINTILKVSKICTAKRIPMIIDVRDLHPEAMRIVFKNELLYNIMTLPMKIMANKAYCCADELIAVSEEYLERGLQVNKKVKNPKVVYIGATMDRFNEGIDNYAANIQKSDSEFWVTYVGTIGTSYDLKTPILAIDKLKKAKNINVRLKILGQGPEEDALKRLVHERSINNIDFMGFLDYEKMAAFLSKSDIALNCIKKNASQSIINKVADYFASGIPMLNSCCNKEMQWLIENFNTGLNYEAENEEDFIEKFMKLYDNQELRLLCGNNARKLAAERFDRANSYKEIIKTIDTVQFQG